MPKIDADCKQTFFDNKNKPLYYAGVNSYGINMSYDSIGWGVLAFGSKKERRDYIYEFGYNDSGNQIAEIINSKIADRILGHTNYRYYLRPLRLRNLSDDVDSSLKVFRVSRYRH